MANFKLDDAAKYATTHEWVRIEDGVAFVGITDAAQDMLSDIVYVELPEEGATVSAGEEVGTVESVKAAEDIVAPISGTIIEVNRALETTPEIINQRPYTAWFFKIEPSGSVEKELASLMSPSDYDKFVAESSH
jgi:glycine cleavage system H protein